MVLRHSPQKAMPSLSNAHSKPTVAKSKPAAKRPRGGNGDGSNSDASESCPAKSRRTASPDVDASYPWPQQSYDTERLDCIATILDVNREPYVAFPCRTERWSSHILQHLHNSHSQVSRQHGLVVHRRGQYHQEESLAEQFVGRLPPHVMFTHLYTSASH